jgi:phosphate transport system permease protein
MAVTSNQRILYFLPLQGFSLLLLALFSLSLGLSYALPIILISEIALFMFAREKMGLFFYLWQLPFFFVVLLGTVFEPIKFYNVFQIPGYGQIAIVIVLVVVELILTSLAFMGERPIKAILFGSTGTLIAAVVLIVLLIGSEGMQGLMETNPLDSMTSTTWYPDYNPEMIKEFNISTSIKPYDFGISVNDANTHLRPNGNASVCLSIVNQGALDDSYVISLTTDALIEVNLSQDRVMLEQGARQGVSISLTAGEEGTSTILIDVVSVATGISKTQQVQVDVAERGLDFDQESYEQHVAGAEVTGLIPLNLTNTGIEGANITFKITSPQQFRPSIEEIPGDASITWDYVQEEGWTYLGAGETGHFLLNPRFLTLADGCYEVRIDAVGNGTNVQASFLYVLNYAIGGGGNSVNDWPMPLDPSVNTTWQVVIKASGHYGVDLKLKEVPDGYSFKAYINGSLVDLRDWSRLNLANGMATVTIVGTTTQATLDQPMPLTMEVRTSGQEQHFGMAAFIVGSAITVVLALVMAVPLALGSAIYLAEYAPARLRRIIKPIMEILAGIPSVVYGLWGALTLGPLLSDTAYPVIGSTLGAVIPFFSSNSYDPRSIMTACIVLAIMIFPIIMALSYDAIAVVPSELKDASLATGASKWQTIRRVIMVKARSGIIASILLGLGRAIGETMAVLMIMGCVSRIPENAFDSVGTMTTVIASQFAGTFAYDSSRHGLFAIALILFIMVFILNLVVLRVTTERTKKGLIKGLTSRLSKSMRKLLPARPNDGMGTTDHTKLFFPTRRIEIFDQMAKYGMFACAAILIMVVAFILGNILVRGGTSFDISYLFYRESAGGAAGGFLNAVSGSLMLVGIAIGVSAPISVLAAIYISEYSNETNVVTRATSIAINTLASTPSIVFGVFGFILFVLYLEFGSSLLAGGLTLALMAMPLIFVSTYEGLKAVPPTLREASYALGVSKWATIRNVVLPVSFSNISSGVIIAIGRTIGETAAVMLTAGYAMFVTDSLFEPVASMPNMIYIYYDTSSTTPGVGEKLYALSFLLVGIVLILNMVARYIAYRSQRKMGMGD